MQYGSDWEMLRAFLSPDLSQLHSPWLMPDITPAVSRIQQALRERQPILIYGDYDVDGTTAVSILSSMLRRLGTQPHTYIPHRLDEGYGLQASVLEQMAKQGIRLVITVDNGIRAHAEVERARELGLDVIITDHHLPAARLPRAQAIVNPSRSGSLYPNPGLCGAGVAFKLGQALLEAEARLQSDAYPPWLLSYFKLLALGTIADHMPLTGENRVIARLGLEGLADPRNPGLRALLQLALPDGGAVRAADVAYRLAPRMNAAGRMDHAAAIVDLFTADSNSATQIAQQLELWNRQRQECENLILEEIAAQIEAQPAILQMPLLMLEGENWHRGVLGIVAARLQRQYQRPVLVICREKENAHGSGRSTPGFNLLTCLEGCAKLLTRFGGHAQAVGFSLPVEQLHSLRQYLSNVGIPESDTSSRQSFIRLVLDEIAPFYRDLQRLEPFGAGNPEPRCFSSNVRLLRPVQWLKEKHLKLTVGEPGLEFECLGWNFSPQRIMATNRSLKTVAELRPGDFLDLSYRLAMGRDRLQWIIIEDVHTQL